MSAPLLPAPLYQGGANAWECDEGGHLNVRFQLERAMIGLAHMAAALDMPRAFTPAAGATLLPLDMHVRFLKEARPGAALAMHGGVAEISESEAVFCLDMRHGDAAPATAFRIRAAHVEPRSMKLFPWSDRTRAAAARLSCTIPEHAAPRSVDPDRAPRPATLARAITLGATRTGAFVVMPDQCDAFGRLRAEHTFGRASDSVPSIAAAWRTNLADAVAQSGGAPVQPAGAVVEARVQFRRWPRVGDLIEVRSALVEVGEKTNRLSHWLLDPVNGEAWATIEALTLTFDALTRKTLTPSAEARAAMQKRAIAEMLG